MGASANRKIKKILAVGDCDRDRAVAFENIASQAERAFGTKPKEPNTDTVIDQGGLQCLLRVLIIPERCHGHLESLLQKTVRDRYPNEAAWIDQLQKDTGVSKWENPLRRDEMWLCCMLAIVNEKKPFVPLSRAFNDYPDLIPVGHKSLNGIRDVIRDFFESP